MSNTFPTPRILFLGMQGPFSLPPLLTLLAQNVEICAVILPATPPPGTTPLPIAPRNPPSKRRTFLPLAPTPNMHTSIIGQAWQHSIPVWEVSNLNHSDTLSTLATYQPDLICVACFSLRIPRSILDLPSLGSLNLHPSLLPDNRGPDPLFWTFRNDAEQTGVTIHYITEGLDDGPVLAQHPIPVPSGITYADFQHQCALIGAELLSQTILDLLKNRVIPIPQNEQHSTYYPFPTPHDLIIHSHEWHAHHAYNFIRAINQSHGPVILYTDSTPITVQQVISYIHNDSDVNFLPHQQICSLWIKCKTGSLQIIPFRLSEIDN